MQRLTVSALVSALVLIAPNIAEAAEEQQEAVVTFGDLDMMTERDAARALHRIRRAAEDVCDAAPGLQTMDVRIATRACVQDAMARAVEGLANPLVLAQFNGRRLYARRGDRAEGS